MKKLLLSLEDLTVDSFVVVGEADAVRGTVHGLVGEQFPDDSQNGCNTDGPTCGPEHTCGYYYDTCKQTYEYTCYPCDASDWCDTADNVCWR